MGGKKSDNTVPETALDREMATIGLDKYQNYKQTFQPLEKYAIGQVTNNSDSQKRMAQGVTNANEEQQFGQAQGQVTAADAALGARPGSGKFGLGLGQFSADQGQAMGLAQTDSNLMSERNRTGNLQSLINIGQGQSGQALSGLATSAEASQQQAVMDARASVAAHQAVLNAAGTAVGFGGYNAYKGLNNPGEALSTGLSYNTTSTGSYPYSPTPNYKAPSILGGTP